MTLLRVNGEEVLFSDCGWSYLLYEGMDLVRGRERRGRVVGLLDGLSMDGYFPRDNRITRPGNGPVGGTNGRSSTSIVMGSFGKDSGPGCEGANQKLMRRYRR